MATSSGGEVFDGEISRAERFLALSLLGRRDFSTGINIYYYIIPGEDPLDHPLAGRAWQATC